MATNEDHYQTLEEAEEFRQELTLEVQNIQAQLGDKQRTDDDGHRLTSTEYWAWKKKAQHALNQKLSELREVKKWMREKNAVTVGFAIHQAVKIIFDLCEVIEANGLEDESLVEAKAFLAKTPQAKALATPESSS